MQNNWRDLEGDLLGDSIWIGVVGAVVGANNFLRWVNWSALFMLREAELTHCLLEGPSTEALVLTRDEGERRPDAPDIEDGALQTTDADWFSRSDGHSPASVVSVELSCDAKYDKRYSFTE